MSTCIGICAPAKTAWIFTLTPSYSSSSFIHVPATDAPSKRIPSFSSTLQMVPTVYLTSGMADDLMQACPVLCGPVSIACPELKRDGAVDGELVAVVHR